MHQPVQVSVLEEGKIWGMLPRELAYASGGVSFLLAAGFAVAAFLTQQWWFFGGTVLAGITGAALQALSVYLRDLAYANSDLIEDEDER
jgi:hypothetical protein